MRKAVVEYENNENEEQGERKQCAGHSPGTSSIGPADLLKLVPRALDVSPERDERIANFLLGLVGFCGAFR